MSWQDVITNPFTITTGDSKQYKLFWMNPTKAIEYNTVEFEFPELEGTLVKRGTPLGRKFNLEVYFQGADHLTQAEAFEVSAKDKRPWSVEHPFYNTIIVQPTSLLFDNTDLNVTKITGTLIETILEDNPKTSFEPADQIPVMKLILDDNLAASLKVKPSLTDVNTMLATNETNFNLTVPNIKLPEEFEEMENLFNTAKANISTAATSVSLGIIAVRQALEVISYPSRLTLDVKTKLSIIQKELENLRTQIFGATQVSQKQIFQSQGGAAVSAMCVAAITPLPGNYTNSSSALSVIDILMSNYNNFIADLDSLQTTNGGNTNSFIPDAQSLIGLNDLMNLTISSLFAIALNSKQERTFITDKDTNVVLLTHRFYGLDSAGANIDEMIANNNIGLNELLQIKKGRKILYYI